MRTTRRRSSLPRASMSSAVVRGDAPAGAAQAEALGAGGADLVQERGRHQELAIEGIELVEDVRGQVAVEGIGLAAAADDVLLRPPRLEQDAGDPSSRGLDGGGSVDLR